MTVGSAMLDLAGRRHGVVNAPWTMPMSACEPDGIWNVAVSYGDTDESRSAAGGIAFDLAEATFAAVGEAAERYAAAVAPLEVRTLEQLEPGRAIPLEEWSLFEPSQRRREGFPAQAQYSPSAPYVEATAAADGSAWWVPRALVSLDAEGVGISSSTGLAAGRTRAIALLRALQEIVERDALAVTWLHGVPGRRVPAPAAMTSAIERRGGEFVCVDATPTWSSHPVAIVAGSLPSAGIPRVSLGAACRATWAEAVRKAFLEWIQGVVFAGVWTREPSHQIEGPADVTDFDAHAGYYTLFPERWRDVPLIQGSEVNEPPADSPRASPLEEFEDLLAGLMDASVRVFYRDLTTTDVAAGGLTVVRVLSPELTPLHFDHNWPFLGGRTADVFVRYPWARGLALTYPSPHPHSLG